MAERRPVVVALTGNIASGKSVVAESLARRGAVIIDADVLAREAVEPGSAALATIVKRWGNDVLTPDGALARTVLRQKVFGDRQALDDLNSIVHPEVERLRQQRVAEAIESGAKVIVCDIPLLYETGLDASFDIVILVDAPEETRLKRLTGNRGLSRDEALRMARAQLDSTEKRERATYVIDNDDTLGELEERVEAVWRGIMRGS